MNNLEQWKERAERATFPDILFNILADWERDLENIRKASFVERQRYRAELDAIETWTHIDENDPTTLPEDSSAKGYDWTWYSAAWVDSNGYKYVEKSSFQDGEWYDWRGPGATLRGPHWRVYAWKPWPNAPSVRDTKGESNEL